MYLYKDISGPSLLFVYLHGGEKVIVPVRFCLGNYGKVDKADCVSVLDHIQSRLNLEGRLSATFGLALQFREQRDGAPRQ